MKKMEHIASIIWLLSLPVIIFIVYKASKIGLKIFENNNKKKSKTGQEKN